MARVETAVFIRRPAAAVWQTLVDWEGQARWMRDARSVVVLTPQRQGEGVIVRCRTDLGVGVVVTDDMLVTDWVPEARIGVRHLGRLIRGYGGFELHPVGARGTWFVWWEVIEAPLGRLGELALRAVVVPWIRRVFAGSLADLKAHCEAAA